MTQYQCWPCKTIPMYRICSFRKYPNHSKEERLFTKECKTNSKWSKCERNAEGAGGKGKKNIIFSPSSPLPPTPCTSHCGTGVDFFYNSFPALNSSSKIGDNRGLSTRKVIENCEGEGGLKSQSFYSNWSMKLNWAEFPEGSGGGRGELKPNTPPVGGRVWVLCGTQSFCKIYCHHKEGKKWNLSSISDNVIIIFSEIVYYFCAVYYSYFILYYFFKQKICH